MARNTENEEFHDIIETLDEENTVSPPPDIVPLLHPDGGDSSNDSTSSETPPPDNSEYRNTPANLNIPDALSPFRPIQPATPTPPQDEDPSMADPQEDPNVPTDNAQAAAASAFAAVQPPQNNSQQQNNDNQQPSASQNNQRNTAAAIGSRPPPPPPASASSASAQQPTQPLNPNPPTSAATTATHDPQILNLFVNIQQQMHQQAKMYEQQLQQVQSTLQATQQQVAAYQYTVPPPAPATTPASNPATQLPTNINQNMTQPPPDKKILLKKDTKPITLPPFPYEQLENSQSANVTRTKEHTNKLRGLYKEYNSLCRIVVKDEYITPPSMRDEVHEELMDDQRRVLYNIYCEIEETRATLEKIIKVQDASKPTLPTPHNWPDNPNFRIKELVEYLHNTQQPVPGTEYETIWRRTAKFANNKKISNVQFLFGLTSYFTGDAYEFLEDIPANTPLEKIAIDFANRFVTTNGLAEAQHRLENFQRNANETIRVAKSRLEGLIKKALIMYPAEQQPGLLIAQMTEKLKQIVHEKTRQLIKRKEQQYQKQGLVLPIDSIVELIDDIERQNGIPSAAVPAPVSLFNTEVTTDENDHKTQALLDLTSNIHNMWIENELEEPELEINAAVNRNVRFRSTDDALKKLKTTADAMKTYRTQKKLSDHFTKSQWDTATPVAPPRPPTPGPSSTPMDTSDSGRQSRSRETSHNANSRSESERRRQDYRRRSSTYDAYLRARSQSKDATSRQRALTPTSFREREDMRALKEEVQRLRKLANHERSRSRNRDHHSSASNYADDRAPNSSNGHNRYNNSDSNRYNNSDSNRYNNSDSRNRSYSRNRYGDNNIRNRSNSRGRQSYNNSGNNYNNYGRSNSANRGQPVIHAHDGATINMTICHKCGITGAHTPQMCNQIVAVRTADPSEN